MTNLKIAILPIDTTWADVEENLYVVEQLMGALPKGTDIVVLPEIFSTGFINNPSTISRFAEPENDSAVLRKLVLLSARNNVAIAGSIFIKTRDDKHVNRGFFIEPSGEITTYDKHHLFSLSNEAETIKAGRNIIPVVRFRGWNIALAICYDLRFPAWLRNNQAKYDLLLLPSNWPMKRSHAWHTLLAARAIENIAYVVGANRSGHDDYGEYDGLSRIYDYTGQDISHDDIKGIVYAELDRDKLIKFREKFPFLNDADEFVFE